VEDVSSHAVDEAAKHAGSAVPHARSAGEGIPRAFTQQASRGAAAANPDGPAPTPLRLAGLCAWAALLGFVGLVVAVRGLVAILVKVPSWYQPAFVIIGLIGISFTVAAFLTVHHRLVPWLFLVLASGTLLTSIIVTAHAT
jgi:hypothetical protein